MIGLVYLGGSYNYYTEMKGVQEVTGGMAFAQVAFVLSVVSSTIYNMLVAQDESTCSCCTSEVFSNVFYWLYVFINFIMKFALGIALCTHALDNKFPILGCKTWDGRYQALEELTG